jgi:pimeloyl-ACP methyl ester carboxylesterase
LAIGAAVIVTVGAIVFAIVLAPVLASVLGLVPAPAPPPGEVVEIGGGVRLNVLVDGRGPPVVLVHGLGGSAYEWTDFVFWMTGSHSTVVRYDRVGYGYSDRRAADAPHDIASNARELIDLVETLELSSPMVIGWSYGGGVAMRAAEEAPDVFGPIVLVSSVGPKHEAPSAHGSMPLAGRAWPRKWLFSSGLARMFGARAGAKAFWPASVPSEWLDRNISMMALPGVVATYMAERRDYDPAQMRPERLRKPALVIHGTGDRMVSIAVAEDLTDRIRGSRLVRVELAGHMLPLTHPEAISKRARSFARDDRAR